MRRDILLIISLTLALAGPADAGTFERTAFSPENGVDRITRGVARDRVGRDLFSNPYATVTISNVDVYDRFPYVEARHFQVVSDPTWSRLVFGELGRSLRAYDGRGGALGPLSGPRGLAVDEQNRLYVADTGNDRVVVLQALTEFDAIELRPLFAVGDLSRPHDVAFSDGGTPFQPGDDLLYVAETGRNRVVAVALEAAGGRVVAALGDLGSGPGRFAGPLAVAVGREDGANTGDVYVADAHNRRIVHLRHQGGRLEWAGEARHDAEALTSLETDQWGNLYAAAPHQGTVRKFNAALEPVAELRGDLARPRAFHLPFLNLRDHRDGRVSRLGQPSALSLEQWTDASGISMWRLGVEVTGLGVQGTAAPVASFTLTDRASVTLEVADAASGRRLSRRTTGPLGAGAHSIPLLPADLAGAGEGRELLLRVSAASSYPQGPSGMAQTAFQASGGAAALPSRPALLGNTPNPVVSATHIAFLLPDARGQEVSLRILDAQGRLVRTFPGPFAPGLNDVVWDGADGDGRDVRAGVYFSQLDFGKARFSHRMVVVR